MDGNQAVHAMSIDDLYTVERVLAEGRYGRTELVMLDDAGPFVRKRMPLAYACRTVWALLSSAGSARLPKIEAAYEMPDEFVVVYDFIAGQTIEEAVETRGPLPHAQALAAAEGICEALEALHHLGVIHRDITPANIVLAADGPHLIDFGIAQLRGETPSGERDRLGTYGFAAPEQYGFAPADERSDIYALGHLLGYMLCGVNPADKERYGEALRDEGMVPRQMREILEKASAFEPSARFQDAASLLDALEHAEEQPAPAERAERPERPERPEEPQKRPDNAKPARTRPRWARPALAAAVACAAAVLIASILLGNGAGAPAEKAADQAGAQQETAGPSSPSSGASSTGSAASSDGAASSGDEETESSLAVSDIQWYSERSVVRIAFRLHNGGSRTQELPGCRVEAYASDGSVLGTQDTYFESVAAGEDEICTATLMDPGTLDRVEVVPLPADSSFFTDDATAAFTASDIAVHTKSYMQTVVGMLRKDRADSGSYSDGQVEIVVLQHDDAGRLVGMQVSYVTDTMAVGETQPFSVDLPLCEDAAATEVFAY